MRDLIQRIQRKRFNEKAYLYGDIVYDSNCSEPEPEGRTAAGAGPDVPAEAPDPDPVAAACGTYVAATPAAGTAAEIGRAHV